MRLEKATRVLLLLLVLLLASMGLSLAQGPGLDDEEPAQLPHPAEGSPLYDLLTAPSEPPAEEGGSPAAPQSPGDVAQQADLDEWDLPINATGLLYTTAGQVWFASMGTKTGAQSDGAIGKLDPVGGQVTIYAMPGRGNIWDLAEGASGVLWYTTLNAGYVGRFDPATNSVTQWRTPSNHQSITHHPDLVYDAASGDLWFASDTDGQPDGIYRLSPGTNVVTSWNTSPHEGFLGLDMSPDGKLWFTFQQGGKQGVGRLDPATDQVTLWPTGNSRPTKLVAEKADEIWFTELEDNYVSVLIPSTNTLRQYAVPTATSQPYGLLRANGKTWFTEFKPGKISRLDPAAASPKQSKPQPSSFKAPRGTETITPASFAVSPQTQGAKLTTSKVTPTTTDAFKEYALPQGTNSQPLGIALNATPGDVWFTQFKAKRIGKLRGVESPPGPVPDTPTLNGISNPDRDGAYQVCWTKADGATSYRLEEDDNAGFSSPKKVYSGEGTCKNVTGQGPGTWYYRVRGENSNGSSAWSNRRSVKVDPPEPQPGSAFLPMVFSHWGLGPPPPPPGDLKLLPIDNTDGDGDYTVSWTRATGAEAYFLEEATDPGFATAQTVYSGTGTSFPVTDRGAARYYYRVKFRGTGGGLSDWSNVEYADVLWELEPNDDPLTQANGPLVSGLTYYGDFRAYTDSVDNFYLDHLAYGRISVYLSNIPANRNYDLYLLAEDLTVMDSSLRPGNLEEHMTTPPLPAGKFFVQVVRVQGPESMQAYHMKVEH